jgi:hypothetical protein
MISVGHDVRVLSHCVPHHGLNSLNLIGALDDTYMKFFLLPRQSRFEILSLRR